MNTLSHTERNLRRAVFWQNVRQWWPGVLIVAIVLGIGIWWATEPIREEYDMRGMPVQTGTGTIEHIIYPVRRMSSDRTPTVILTVHDLRTRVGTYLPLKRGQIVQVTYRIGRSGRVYVGSIVPLRPDR
jgi:hypothetical protein